MDLELANKVIIVTGGARGIGAGSCQALATEGAIPVIVGRTVADRPMRCAGFASCASSRSRLSARCEPRFVGTTACTSSTMIVSTVRSVSRALLVSSRNSDSGVVMRMSGGCFACARRSSCGVSPVRSPMRMPGGSVPSMRPRAAMPASGARRLRSTSTASAFSGEM